MARPQRLLLLGDLQRDPFQGNHTLFAVDQLRLAGARALGLDPLLEFLLLGLMLLFECLFGRRAHFGVLGVLGHERGAVVHGRAEDLPMHRALSSHGIVKSIPRGLRRLG